MITLEVIDITGNRVRTIADNHFPAGEYRLVWDGKDDVGFEIKSGTYFICFYLDKKLNQTSKIIKSSQ